MLDVLLNHKVSVLYSVATLNIATFGSTSAFIQAFTKVFIAGSTFLFAMHFLLLDEKKPQYI